MSDLAGFLNISYSNSFYFRNANNNDILIYPETSNQIIRIGITSNSTSLLDISSNAVYINSANFGIGLSNPSYKLDVVGDINTSTVVRSVTHSNSGNMQTGTLLSGSITCTTIVTQNNNINVGNGTVYGAFSGNGSGLTSLTAGNLSGSVAVANGGTGATIVTGTGCNVLSDSPRFTGAVYFPR